MSNLMTNIRRVSLPLQESSQHLGRLLLALGQAADSTLDAESLAALDKSAAAAAAATSSGDSKAAASSTAPAAAGEEDPQTAPPSRLEGEQGQEESFAPAAESAESGQARTTTVSMTELLDNPSNHGRPPSATSTAAAAASGDNTSSSNLNKTTPSSFSPTTPLARASSSSVHSASSSSSFHGRTRASSSSASASANTPQQQRPAASAAATAESTPPDSAGSAAGDASAARSPPRKPSPERPVAWRGFGSEEDDDKLVVCESKALAHLFTRVRNRETPSPSFNFYARRMARILAEEAIASLESTRQFITTPTAATFSSVFVNENNVCIVSILRAGDALAEAAQACIPHAPAGKILIQRDEESRDKHPVLFYKKFPPKIASMQVLLCDPMLATGGSALMAIRCLVEAGVKSSAIVFVTVVVCPEGVGAVRAEFPEVTIVTGAMDDCLDERRYILPGIGDFGDRFFGTTL